MQLECFSMNSHASSLFVADVPSRRLSAHAIALQYRRLVQALIVHNRNYYSEGRETHIDIDLSDCGNLCVMGNRVSCLRNHVEPFDNVTPYLHFVQSARIARQVAPHHISKLLDHSDLGPDLVFLDRAPV